MRGLKKVDMKRGQTERYVYKLTSQLIERIGLRDDSLKIYVILLNLKEEKNVKIQIIVYIGRCTFVDYKMMMTLILPLAKK